MPARHSSLVRAAAAVAALALVLGAAAPAHAEKADREKPVNIEADRMFYDDLRQVNIFEGNVNLTQGTLVIRTDKLTVTQDPEGFQFGTADKGAGGLAYFRQKRDNLDEYVEGWGERIEYDAKTDRAKLTTRARIKRGNDSVTGSVINYDGRTEFYTVIGGKEMVTENNPQGRVRAVLTPGKAAATPDGKDGKGAARPAPEVNLRSSGGIAAPRPEYPEGPKK